MPWVRFDDSSPDNPKIDGLTDGAFRLWFNAICYSNRNLTDGHVPRARINRLTPHYKPAHLAELIDAGAFHKDADGVTIHGYLDYQPSSHQIAEQREYERERKARRRANGTANTGNDPTNGRFMSHRDNHRDTDRDNHRESAPESPATQPNPTQPNVSKSSSSSPLVAASHEEEEDEAWREAKRRLALTPSQIANPHAWTKTTAQRLRDDGWTPQPATTPEPTRPYDRAHPDCDTCDTTGWIDTNSDGTVTQCPDCRQG